MTAPVSRSLRLLRILQVCGRYRLDEFIDRERLPALPGLVLAMAPWRVIPAPDMSRGERLRRALEELGPVFIKFGQMLSTRRDLLPLDIADELARLQDDVPPFPEEQSIAIIERPWANRLTSCSPPSIPGPWPPPRSPRCIPPPSTLARRWWSR